MRNAFTRKAPPIAKQKKALEDFRKRCRNVLAWAEETLGETAEQRAENVKKAKTDYEYFVRRYFGHYAKKKTAAFHVRAAEAIRDNARLRAVFEWARGHAKSTHLSLLVPLWLKANGQIKTMVLVSKSQQNAQELLTDLREELESNRLYVRDFGPQKKPGSWREGSFVTRDGTAFFARGRGQSPRGLRKGANRPDYIVIDDLDDDQLVRSPAQVAKMTDWVLEALFGALDMGRGRFVMVGNRIAQDSVLARMAQRPGVYHTVVNALDANGQPSWPDKYTREEIDELTAFMGYRRAQKELFNNPIRDGAVFRAEWIVFGETPPLEACQQLVAYCDPSFKSGASSDYKAVVLVGWHQGRCVVYEAFVRRCTVGEMVRFFYDLQERLPSEASCRYYIEANFAQDSLLDEFEREGQARQQRLPIRPDKRKKPNKHQRVENISPLFERKLIVFDRAKEDDADMQTLVEQLLAFEKGSRAADDGPDALEGALYWLTRPEQTAAPKLTSGFSSGSRRSGSRRSERF